MTELPAFTDDVVRLVRTSWHDDDQWDRLRTVATTPTADGFVAILHVLDDSLFLDAEPSRVASLVPDPSDWAIVVLADRRGQDADPQTVLVVQANEAHEPRTFRCAVEHLWGVENNLTLFNMEWEDFADHVDADVVFRGNFG